MAGKRGAKKGSTRSDIMRLGSKEYITVGFIKKNYQVEGFSQKALVTLLAAEGVVLKPLVGNRKVFDKADVDKFFGGVVEQALTPQDEDV